MQKTYNMLKELVNLLRVLFNLVNYKKENNYCLVLEKPDSFCKQEKITITKMAPDWNYFSK